MDCERSTRDRLFMCGAQARPNNGDSLVNQTAPIDSSAAQEWNWQVENARREGKAGTETGNAFVM